MLEFLKREEDKAVTELAASNYYFCQSWYCEREREDSHCFSALRQPLDLALENAVPLHLHASWLSFFYFFSFH